VDDLLAALNANAGAISAVATVLGVAVAAIYTFYTTRLWKVTVEQSRTALMQAEIAQEQLHLMEQQLIFAKRDFDLIKRPHLKIEVLVERYRLSSDAETAARSMLAVLGQNYGSVAAVVNSAEARVPEGKGMVWGHRPLPIVVPPGSTEVIGRAVLPPVPAESDVADFDNYVREQMLFVYSCITYEGGSVEYTTSHQIWLMPDVKDRTGWAVYGVTPSGSELRKLQLACGAGGAA